MHPFGWIVIGLLVVLVIGGTALWESALVTGHVPFLFYRPYPFFYFPFGFIFFALFVFFIIRIVLWGTWGWRGRYWRYYWGDAKEVVRQRYARGEITREQFEQMNRDLDEHK